MPLTTTLRCWLCLYCLLASSLAFAVPYNGEVFTYYQPDGSTLQVRLFGDEFYAVAETLDGYVVTKDPTTGFYTYADLTSDSRAFESTGTTAGTAIPPGLEPHARIASDARAALHQGARALLGVDDRGQLPADIRSLLRPDDATHGQPDNEFERTLSAPPVFPTSGARVSVVLMARFPDRLGDASITPNQVDAYCNDPDYTGFGNASSVYTYFFLQSNGKFRLNCVVTAYFTASRNRSYYTDASIGYTVRARELVKEGLSAARNGGFNFATVDSNSDYVLDGVNLFYAGGTVNAWSEGLWPHKSYASWSGLADEGLFSFFQYQITDLGDALTLGTFCHENGHMMLDFPDLYPYTVNDPPETNAANVGQYSLMHYTGDVHPPAIDAYLKVHAGWAELVELSSTSNQRGALLADANSYYRYGRPGESREYFLLSMRTNSGYEGPFGGDNKAINPGDGLVIWHAREHGSNTGSSIFSNDSPTDYSKPYELMVVEANPKSNLTPWYRDPDPGSNDTWHSGGRNVASDSTNPALKFWNTSSGRTVSSGLNVHSVGPKAHAITFVAGNGDPTGSPALSITPTALTQVSDYGSNPASRQFAVFNSAGGTLNYAISTDVTWLSINPAAGSVTSEADVITVSYNSSALPAGAAAATITITDTDGANAPINLPVTLTVDPPPAIALAASQSNWDLVPDATGAFTVLVSNSGGGQLGYAISLGYADADNGDWLSLDSNAGTARFEEDQIVATLDTNGLAAGNYSATISVTDTNASSPPQEIAVSLRVCNDFDGDGECDCTPDSFEPDDSVATATLLALDSSQEHSICALQDEDWYTFSVTENSAITLETSGPLFEDTRLWLYDSVLQELAFDDDNGLDFYSLIPGACGSNELPPGTYHVAVDAYDDYHEIASYTLAISSEACPLVCPDNDEDALCDNIDPDDDNDRVSDNAEAQSGTNPLLRDSDFDEVEDYEDAFPLNNAADADADHDRLPDAWNANCNSACQTASGLTLDSDATTADAAVVFSSLGASDSFLTDEGYSMPTLCTAADCPEPYFSQGTSSFVTEGDFELVSLELAVSDISGVSHPPGVQPLIDVAIYSNTRSDSIDAPGMLLAVRTVSIPQNDSCLPEADGCNALGRTALEQLTTVSFTTPVPLNAGQRYWIGLHPSDTKGRVEGVWWWTSLSEAADSRVWSLYGAVPELHAMLLGSFDQSSLDREAAFRVNGRAILASHQSILRSGWFRAVIQAQQPGTD